MSDRQLQQSVIRELDWEPAVAASNIGITAHEGVVTLLGAVSSYQEKFWAEEAAKRVFGVRGVVNDLRVELPHSAQLSDSEIAEAAAFALATSTSVPPDHVQVSVREGEVCLEGEVDNQHQRTAAEFLVDRLTGVREVHNRITVKPHASVADIKTLIEAALHRAAEVEARRINVETEGGTVTLSGTVHSWHEKNEALRAAWRAPGVLHVQDQLHVQS